MQEFRRHQLRIIFPTTYRYDNAISVALDALAACLSSPPSSMIFEMCTDRTGTSQQVKAKAMN